MPQLEKFSFFWSCLLLLTFLVISLMEALDPFAPSVLIRAPASRKADQALGGMKQESCPKLRAMG